MDIIAAPELIVERTIVMIAAVLVFGALSIGGLWLLRRYGMSAASVSTPDRGELNQEFLEVKPQKATLEAMHLATQQIAKMAAIIEELPKQTTLIVELVERITSSKVEETRQEAPRENVAQPARR
jgi:hypothetical protein